MKIGYARVSTRAQGDSLATQEETLREQGCEKVFADTISGAKSSRPEFDMMLDQVRPGDVIMATRLDRLGRTALDTLRTIDELAKRDIPVVLLKPELDTRSKEGRLMVTIMSGLAEFERDLLIERTREGLAAARARGREGGRPRSISTKKRELLRKLVREDQMGVEDAGRELGISRAHAYRILNEATAG